jgi:hypothetical protein
LKDTMKKLLLLDADIIIDLHALDLFRNLCKAYDIHVTKAVIDEAKFYKKDGASWPINILSKVTIIDDIEVDALREVNIQAKKAILQIDPGEATAIAYLIQSDKDIKFCSCDKAAITLVSFMDREEKCISLEKALKEAGHHNKTLYPRHLNSSLEDCIKMGKELRIYKMKLT